MLVRVFGASTSRIHGLRDRLCRWHPQAGLRPQLRLMPPNQLPAVFNLSKTVTSPPLLPTKSLSATFRCSTLRISTRVYGLQRSVAQRLASLVNSQYNSGWACCGNAHARTPEVERFIDLLVEIGHISAHFPSVLRGTLVDAWVRWGGNMDCCAARRARLKIAFDADPGMTVDAMFAALDASPPRYSSCPGQHGRPAGSLKLGRCAACSG